MNITEESQQIMAFFEEAKRRKMGQYGKEEDLDFDFLHSKYTTDEVFELLPSTVYFEGNSYHFNLVRGRDGVIVYYEQNKEDGGEKLGKTSRRDYKLKSALIRMYIFLKLQNYI